jgi:N4-gp56 family major capsid protein
MADVNKYGDQTPREAGFSYGQLLERAVPGVVTELGLATKPMPKKQTNTIIFRRINSLSAATVPLGEGVTPAGSKPTYTDVTMVMQQFGDFVAFTDQMEDFHPDNVISEFGDILAEQMRKTRELLNIAFMKAGTSVYYANGTGRTDVNTFTTVGQLKKVVRYLRKQNAKYITKIIKATPMYATGAVAPSYIAFGDTDLAADLEALPGYRKVEDYADSSRAISDYEHGTVAGIRFILTSEFTAWADAGGLENSMITTTGANADVYPIIIMGENAACTVALRGEESGHTTFVSTKPAKGDDLGQRGSTGWKFYHTGGILNDSWMARVEVAATLNPVA